MSFWKLGSCVILKAIFPMKNLYQLGAVDAESVSRIVSSMQIVFSSCTNDVEGSICNSCIQPCVYLSSHHVRGKKLRISVNYYSWFSQRLMYNFLQIKCCFGKLHSGQLKRLLKWYEVVNLTNWLCMEYYYFSSGK